MMHFYYKVFTVFCMSLTFFNTTPLLVAVKRLILIIWCLVLMHDSICDLGKRFKNYLSLLSLSQTSIAHNVNLWSVGPEKLLWTHFHTWLWRLPSNLLSAFSWEKGAWEYEDSSQKYVWHILDFRLPRWPVMTL